MSLNRWMKSGVVTAVCAVLLFALSAGLRSTAAEKEILAREQLFGTMLPADSYEELPYEGDDAGIRAVYRAGEGRIIEVETDGYVDSIVLWVAVDADGTIKGIAPRKVSETMGLGGRVKNDTGFLSQFLGKKTSVTVGQNIDALTGATVSSKAVARAINAARAVVTGEDTESGASEWEEGE